MLIHRMPLRHIPCVTNHITGQRVYVSGRISNEVMVIIILFMFAVAILNISISSRVPEGREPDYEYIGHLV